MNKALLSICVLLLTQTSFAGHHEKSEKDTKTIIGYEILDGEKLEIIAGDASAIDIWVKYVEAHNTRDLETINSLNASDFEGRAANGLIVKGPEAHAEFLKEWFSTSNPSWGSTILSRPTGFHCPLAIFCFNLFPSLPLRYCSPKAPSSPTLV